jgi:hypothetical protein
VGWKAQASIHRSSRRIREIIETSGTRPAVVESKAAPRTRGWGFAAARTATLLPTPHTFDQAQCGARRSYPEASAFLPVSRRSYPNATPAQVAALTNWVARGNALVGLHGATVTGIAARWPAD